MNDASTEQIEREIINFDISDEALEAAGIAINSAAVAALVYCAAVMRPWWEDS
jgi:hypothetical protein